MPISRDILVSLAVGMFLIAGAFYVSAGDEPVPGEVTVAQATPTRQYIEPTDSDGNGISDWAEELIDDRELFLESLADTAAEEYVHPETLTGRFSIKFFQDYLLSKGYGGAFEDNKDTLITDALSILEREARDMQYGLTDITTIDDNSEAALRRYANTMASITMNAPVELTDTEALIVQQALSRKNPSRLADLDPIITTYEFYRDSSLEVAVPSSLAAQHVDIINVYHAISRDIIAMRNMFEDPLLGLIRLNRYQENTNALIFVYYNLNLALNRAGVIFNETEPGILFTNLARLKVGTE